MLLCSAGHDVLFIFGTTLTLAFWVYVIALWVYVTALWVYVIACNTVETRCRFASLPVIRFSPV